MRTLLTIIGAATLVAGLAWPSGAFESASASPASSPHVPTRIEHLGCQAPTPDLPPKDLSRLPEFECR